jgi:hypothetical protein
MILGVGLCAVRTAPASESLGETNAPPLVTIVELLKNKEQWKSKIVEVRGYYSSDFERSALYRSKQDSRGPRARSLWVDPRDPPGKTNSILWNASGFVRIIGTFEFRKEGSGHLNTWPAEITNIQLVEFIAAPEEAKNAGQPRPQ